MDRGGLFIVMLPKTHLTSHSRISGSRWVITPSWFLGHYYIFCLVFLCILATFSYCLLLLLGLLFLSFIVPIFEWNIPLVALIFLKGFLVFPFLLLSSISLHWSLRKAFFASLAILSNSAFRCIYLSFSLCLSLFFSQLFARPLETNFFVCAFCISFSGGWFWSLPPV